MSENANINVLADPNVAVLEKKPKDDNPTVETASPVGEKRSGEPPLEEEKEEESVEEKNGDESIEEEKDDEKAVEEEKDKEPVEEQKGEEQPEVKKDEESSEEKKSEESIGEKKSEEPTEEKIDERVTKEKNDEGAIGEKTDDVTTEEKKDDVTTEEKKDDVKTEEKKDDATTEAKKEKDAAEVQREADLLAELFPTEAENPVTGTAEEVVTTTPVEPKKKTNSIASLFKKAEKRPLEERLAEAEKEKASNAEDDASVAAPSAAAASDTPAKAPAKRAKKAMPQPEADNSKNQDIRTFFKKLPTKDEMFEEKRKVREAEREKQRELEKKERDNFLYNKEKQRIVPESFHSEKFRDVPMGSLLGDAELDKASSMKTVSMQEFLLTMAAKKKREQDIRDGVCVDEPAEPLPPAKKSRKRK